MGRRVIQIGVEAKTTYRYIQGLYILPIFARRVQPPATSSSNAYAVFPD